LPTSLFALGHPSMAEGIRVYGASAITHRCVLHDDERITVCSGTLKKGGNCINKAADASASGMMPTCKIHRDQLKVSGWCRAPLPCGFKCGRIFEWKPHGFQLCSLSRGRHFRQTFCARRHFRLHTAGERHDVATYKFV
jgi:hypothetical protein